MKILEIIKSVRLSLKYDRSILRLQSELSKLRIVEEMVHKPSHRRARETDDVLFETKPPQIDNDVDVDVDMV